MIIVFGTRTLKNKINTTLEYNCPICQHERATVLSTWRWFTLFWIPVFPIGKKKYWKMCNLCQNGYELSKEEAQQIKQYSQN